MSTSFSLVVCYVSHWESCSVWCQKCYIWCVKCLAVYVIASTNPCCSYKHAWRHIFAFRSRLLFFICALSCFSILYDQTNKILNSKNQKPEIIKVYNSNNINALHYFTKVFYIIVNNVPYSYFWKEIRYMHLAVEICNDCGDENQCAIGTQSRRGLSKNRCRVIFK